MCQASCGACFLVETRLVLFTVFLVDRNEDCFDRQRAIQDRIFRFVYDAHRTATQFVKNPVTAQLGD